MSGNSGMKVHCQDSPTTISYYQLAWFLTLKSLVSVKKSILTSIALLLTFKYTSHATGKI